MPISYESLRAAVRGRRLPCALLDLDAVDRNCDTLAGLAAAGNPGVHLRVASKSLRSVPLLRHLLARLGPISRGVMTFTAAETAFLAAAGLADLLLAYPTLQRADLDDLCGVAARGALAALVVDSAEHVTAAAACARAHGVVLPLALDLDVSYRRFGGLVHAGVRRSPIRGAADALQLARQVLATPGVTLRGILAYEAQVAGLPDRNPFSRLTNPVKRALRAISRSDVARLRAEVVAALRACAGPLDLVNGGGTGSLTSTPRDAVITEVTAGSGFVCPHLFDYYSDLTLEPAAFFAVQAARKPDPRIVTCHGGGYAASGQAGRDRLPRPWLPGGLTLLAMEGAGEVQTPLRCAQPAALRAGDPVFFRHAKAGELAEHFCEYLLIRGGELAGSFATYRGQGQCFL